MLFRSKFEYTLCNDFEYESNSPHNLNPVKDGFAYVNDWYFRTTSFTNDIIANRYSFRNTKEHYHIINQVDWRHHNNHYLFYKYLSTRQLSMRMGATDYDLMSAIRHNFPKDIELDKIKFVELYKLFEKYGRPNEEKFYGVGSPHFTEFH